MRWSRFGFLSLLALAVSGAALTAGLGREADLLDQDSLWVASPRGIAGLSLSDGGEPVLIQASGAERILADKAAGRVWILTSTTVSAFDSGGLELFRSPLPGAPGALPQAVLRPADHSLWIASGSRLLAVGAGGQRLREQTFPAPIQALALSPSQDLLWIVSGGSLSALDALTLQKVSSRALNTKASPVGLAVDSASGALWIAWPNLVRRYRADGTMDVEAAASDLRLIEPDGQGGAWLATARDLTRLDARGRLSAAAIPLPAAEIIEALAADPIDGSVWIGGSRSLVQVDRSGAVRTVRPFPGGPVRDLAIARGVQGNRPPPERPAPAKERAGAATARPSNVPALPALPALNTALRTVTVYATSDSYLKQGTPNQNLGGESFLRIRSSGPNRALVRFDPAQIAAALAGGTLVSARLEMQIASNGGNWGDGRTVDAHRLTTDWTEAGVTWDCPADAAPSNSQRDCAASLGGWDGGGFAATATASVLHTNASAGRIAFDVTTDIAAVAGGGPHLGWLLKKTQEGQNGLVDYASREVCGEEPRLVLEVASATPDGAPPVLRIDSPSERFLINQPAAPIALSFFDAGSAIDPGSLVVRLDGVDVTATCSVCSSGAVCPWPALTEGPHTVSAGIADAGGHAATASFPFDLLLGDGEHRVTLPVAADTYVRNGSANQNQGGESLLRIRSSGKNRALARFDLSGLEDAVDDLHSATLELFVETNGGNWGTGRTIDAHRLTADWSEPGATWSCAVDTVPGNQNDDCATGWNGGTFAGTASASVLQTNSLTGWVGFDVTADVLSQLAGQAHQGWLVKKRDEGQNGLVEYTSKEGTAGKAPRLVLVFDGGEPVDLTPPSLAITSPAEGSTIDDATPSIAFAWSDAGSGVVHESLAARIGGSPVALACTFGPAAAACAPFDPLADGPVVLTATVADAAGNVSAPAAVHFTIDTSPPEPQLPPDPATVAPPLDRTVATDVFAATAFLYTGASPIQTGVAPGTIDPRRVAVLRGRVLDRQGSALPGVTVAVHDHPELGGTLSRADGRFDLAVNGGGPLVLDFRKAGHLPAQRPVLAPVRDYARVDDVALVPYDETVTTVLGGQPDAQVARGGTVTDDAGTRRSTLLFQPGTTASMVLPDGSVQPLAALSMRSTEYSVGPEGLTAMPAPLPPNTGYTYAVELSADEAVAAGAVRVELSQPAVHYLENFLDFPVGGAVPTGYYDRELAGWVPSGNGRIVQVLGVAAGLADLDVDGSGQPADPELLAGLGVTPEEREAVAQLYAPGQSLWRVPIPHLTPWDYNWPYGPPDDATPPPDPDGPDDDDSDDPHDDPDDDSDDEDDNECEKGSIIECQSQILRDDVLLDGSAWRLHYSSERVTGRGAPRFQKLQVSGDTVPPSLKRIDVEVTVAGQTIYSASYAPAPNLVAKVNWNGKDVYGRPIQGSQSVSVRTRYVYPSRYYAPGTFDQSFSRFPDGVPLAIGRSGSDIVLDRTFVSSGRSLVRNMGNLDWRELGLGGWSLSVHHLYDPTRHALYTGYGERRSADPLGRFLINRAGTGNPGYSGDGGPARRAELSYPSGVAVAADGSVYVADTDNHVVRRISPSGGITTVAGTGGICEEDDGGGDEEEPPPPADHCGDGGPALQARLTQPRGVVLAPDGRLYIADTGNRCVRRIERNGTITTAAGLCEGRQSGGEHLTASGEIRSIRAQEIYPCYSGELCRATETRLYQPTSLAVDRDGGLYITDEQRSVVYFVGLDGYLNLVAGDGFPEDGVGDGLPAVQAGLYFPAGITVAPDGSLYIADYGHDRVRRVGRDGVIRTVAGTGESGYSGDGGPAGEAQLFGPAALAFAPDGGFYIAEADNARIRHVSPDGIISTFAGTGDFSFGSLAPDGTSALGMALGRPLGVALAPNGTLLVADYYNQHVGSFGTDLPGFTNEEILLRGDGDEVFVFDPAGRHLRTLHALTGAELLAFRYTGDGGEGLLSEVEDAYGNVTRIERDATGKPLAIVAPFGQRTELELDEQGYLASAADPGDLRVNSFTYDQGLLTSRIDPRGNPHEYSYDLLGRLIRNDDPAGGFKTLTRGGGTSPQNYTVTTETAMGRRTERRVSTSTTAQTLRQRETAGLGETIETVDLVYNSGLRFSNRPGGQVVTLQRGPDAAWGAARPRPKTLQVRTPSGLISTVQVQQGVELSDPDDPFSIVSKDSSAVVNDAIYTSSYDGATRTSTWQTPEGRRASAQFDQFGRITLMTVPGFVPAFWNYDSKGRLSEVRQGTGPDERKVTFTYRPDGRLSSITDPVGRIESMDYDQLGRVTSLVRPDGSQINLAYDANGNTVALSPPGRPVHSFEHTPVDLTSTYAPPLAGSAAITSYAFDADRRLSEIQQPGGRSIGINYDRGGRPTGVVTDRGTTSITYRHGTFDPLTVTTPEGNRLTHGYDGHLLTSNAWSGEVNGSVQRTYDNSFYVLEERVNGGNAVAFSYDGDGLLTAAGSLAVTRDQTNGLVAATALGSVITTTAYNDFAEPAGESAAFEGTALWQVGYTRDKLGRIVEKLETVGGVTSAFTYAYDLVGRLVKVEKDGVLFAEYTYGANGNRQSYAGSLGSASGTYDDQDRLLGYGDTNYTYTGKGDLASKAQSGETMTYDYDELGNLLRVELPTGIQIDYVVDGRSRRIGKKVNGVLVQGFLYRDQLKPAAELDGSGQIVARFVYGTRSNVPDYMVKGGRTYRILADHLGSPRLVVDTVTGEIAQRMDYDEFGNVILDTNPRFQPFGFAGGLYDSHTGLVRFGARDYDPHTGRWTAKDPLGFHGGDADLYAYVMGDPVNRVDPSGLSWGSAAKCFATGAAMGAVGALAVGALAVGAVALGAPVAAVTLGLGALAIVGGSMLTVDTTIAVADRNWDEVAYNAGSFAGGLVAGLSGGRALARGINRVDSGPIRYNDAFQNYKAELGTVWEWLGTGPNSGSGGASAGFGGGGASTTLASPCGCQ